MNALRFSYQNNRSLELKRISKPEVSEPDDILIKVAYAGICVADFKILQGVYNCRRTSDLTPGHEFVGVIEDVGRDVIRFQEGDRVGAYPTRGCKRCPFCLSGKPNFCLKGLDSETIGFYKDGGWAQYVICPEEQVFEIPAAIPFDQAVLCEPMCCMVQGFRRLKPLCPGSKILILGAGISGCLWAATMHLKGQRNVTVSEPNRTRLEGLRKLNTGYTLTTPEKLKENAENDPESYLFDIIVDCSGIPSAIEYALTLLNFGGRFCLFGVTEYSVRIKLNIFDLFWKEQTLFGVKANPSTYIRALGLIEAMGDRYLNYSALGLRIYRLEDYKEALEVCESGTIVKGIFKMRL